MGLDNVLDILRMDLNIGRIVGHNPDNGSLGAEAEASGSHDINTATQTVLGNDADKIIDDFQAARIVASRPTTTQDLKMAVTNQTVYLGGIV